MRSVRDTTGKKKSTAVGNEKGEQINSKIKKTELGKYHFRELNKEKEKKNEEKNLCFFFFSKCVGNRRK